MSVVEQIERKLEEIIGCAYSASVDNLCIQHMFELSQLLVSASPSYLKALIVKYQYQTRSQRDEMAYRKR